MTIIGASLGLIAIAATVTLIAVILLYARLPRAFLGCEPGTKTPYRRIQGPAGNLMGKSAVIGTVILFTVLTVPADPVAVPIPTEQALQYQDVRDLAWGINQFLTLLVPVALMILASRTTLTRKLGKYPTFAIHAAILFMLSCLVQLPFDRIRSNALNRTEGNPSLPFAQWVLERFPGSLATIAFSVLAALFVFWLINRSPRRWWLWATGVFSFLFLAFLIGESLTAKYRPLGQTPVEIRIAELADRIGVPRGSVVLEDCEPFDRCEIAHVSSLGPTRVILLNKALFENYPEAWSVQSFAHEAKHFLKDDNLTGWLVMTALLLVFFWLLDRISRLLIGRFPGRFGIASPGEPAALPLVVLILSVLYLIALPPVNIFRQHVEFEADRFGLELTNENEEFAKMVSSWTARSKTRVPDPGLLFMLFRSSHPSDADRIAYANERQSKGRK
jgi:STE24 endopeptidase